VKSYIRETRLLHKSDFRDEERKTQTVSCVYESQCLQPRCLSQKLTEDSLYLTAIVPVLKEVYSASFQKSRKPVYTLSQSDFLHETQILAILTPDSTGQLPPITVCQQMVDMHACQHDN